MMENNNNDLFELMTKMYAEMQDMKSEQRKTNERLGNLESRFDNLESKVDTLESKVDTGFQNLTARMDDISKGIGSVVGSDVSETLSDKINSINSDLGFIKHKLNITEEDVYKIKSHLRIVK